MHVFHSLSDSTYTMPVEALESGTNKGLSINGRRVNTEYGAPKTTRTEKRGLIMTVHAVYCLRDVAEEWGRSASPFLKSELCYI